MGSDALAWDRICQVHRPACAWFHTFALSIELSYVTLDCAMNGNRALTSAPLAMMQQQIALQHRGVFDLRSGALAPQHQQCHPLH